MIASPLDVCLPMPLMHLEINIPIPLINIPKMQLEIPMDGLVRAMYEHEGNTFMVYGGLRAEKLMECTTNLCIGYPTTIGGALRFDL
jgi:hypothetical protein